MLLSAHKRLVGDLGPAMSMIYMYCIYIYSLIMFNCCICCTSMRFCFSVACHRGDYGCFQCGKPPWQTSLANLLGSLAIHTVGDPHASWGHPRTWQLVPSDPQTTTLPSGGFLQSWRQQTSCEGTISDFGPRHDSHDHFRVTTVRTPVAGSPPTFCAG